MERWSIAFKIKWDKTSLLFHTFLGSLVNDIRYKIETSTRYEEIGWEAPGNVYICKLYIYLGKELV